MQYHADRHRAAEFRTANHPLMIVATFAMGIAAVISASSSAQAQAPAQGARNEKDIRIKHVLQTDDGWTIYISYYPAPGDRESITKESPVVVLLHGDRNNRFDFERANGLAPLLQAEKFAVITVDLRKHGQSTNVGKLAGDSPVSGKNSDGANITADDYQNMVDHDLEAVKKFIYEEHQAKHLNMRKMGIVAAESSASVALCFAVTDWTKEPYDDAPVAETKTPRGQDVRALVLLSPPQRTKGLPVAEMINQARNPEWGIAFLTLYGKLNKTDMKDGVAVYHKLAGSSKANEDRIYQVGYNVKLRGVGLLGKKEVDAEFAIVKFLKRHLASLPESEWRDRQSRLTKK
jgi:pimeloyl-ACP methyl ester carboxylesterase